MPMVEVECLKCGSRNVEENYGVCNCLDCGSSDVEKVDKI
jgi:predicted nucleic-acid-binding Zn-ribbon protein